MWRHLQNSGLRRVDARTQTAIKLDAERPEYHRVSLSWHRWCNLP